MLEKRVDCLDCLENVSHFLLPCFNVFDAFLEQDLVIIQQVARLLGITVLEQVFTKPKAFISA